MVTITFQTESNNADLQRLLDLARRFQLSFHINEEPKKTKADVLKDVETAIKVGNLTSMELQRLNDLWLSYINEEPKKTKADVLKDIESAMIEVQQKRKSGQPSQSIESFLNEIDEELSAENLILNHAD